MSTWLTLMLCLRYGQGSDYFGYMTNYMWYMYDQHNALVWKLFETGFSILKIPFEVFVCIIGLISMWCMSRFIWLYSPYKLVSLLMVYPTIYLTYFMSGMRQGIVIAFFVGYMFNWLQEEKYVNYLVGCLAMVLIHSSALVFLPLIFVNKIKEKCMYYFICLCTIAGIIIYVLPTSLFTWLPNTVYQYYVQNKSISVLGIAERVVMLCSIIILLAKNRKEDGNVCSKAVTTMMKIYLYGMGIVLLTFSWSIISSRLSAPFKAIEFALIPLLASRCSESFKRIIVTIVCLYVSLMTVKNIKSYLDQAPEYQTNNPLEYPYLSVFNEEKARKIRKDRWEWCINYDKIYRGEKLP